MRVLPYPCEESSKIVEQLEVSALILAQKKIHQRSVARGSGHLLISEMDDAIIVEGTDSKQRKDSSDLEKVWFKWQHDKHNGKIQKAGLQEWPSNRNWVYNVN